MELTTQDSFPSTEIDESYSLDALLNANDILIYACLAASLLTMVVNPFTILAMAMYGMLKKTAANLFIASLCFADLMLGVSVFLMKLQELVIRSSNHKNLIAIISWAAAGLVTIGHLSSLLTALIIGVDRAIATMTPLKYRTMVTHKRAIIALILLWTCLSCLVLGPLFTTLLSLDEGESLPLLTQPQMAFPQFFNYVVPPTFIVLLISNGLLYIAIVTAFNKVAKKSSSTDKRSRRLTKMSIVVVGSFILGNMPIYIFVTIPVPTDFLHQMRAGLMYNSFTTITLIPTFANNFIYAWHLSEFRNAYGRLLRCYRNTGIHPGQSMSGTGHSSTVQTQE